MNYEQSVNSALKLLEDRTELQQFTAAVSARQPDDQDAFVLGRTDDEIKAIAKMSWESLNIPASRLPRVEKDVLAGRVIAQERRNWCRHLELLQDLRHTQRSDTAYQTDPARVCVCQKLGYKSSIPHPDYDAVITGFKRAYCEGCATESRRARPANRPVARPCHIARNHRCSGPYLIAEASWSALLTTTGDHWPFVALEITPAAHLARFSSRVSVVTKTWTWVSIAEHRVQTLADLGGSTRQSPSEAIHLATNWQQHWRRQPNAATM